MFTALTAIYIACGPFVPSNQACMTLGPRGGITTPMLCVENLTDHDLDFIIDPDAQTILIQPGLHACGGMKIRRD